MSLDSRVMLSVSRCTASTYSVQPVLLPLVAHVTAR